MVLLKKSLASALCALMLLSAPGPQAYAAMAQPSPESVPIVGRMTFNEKYLVLGCLNHHLDTFPTLTPLPEPDPQTLAAHLSGFSLSKEDVIAKQVLRQALLEPKTLQDRRSNNPGRKNLAEKTTDIAAVLHADPQRRQAFFNALTPLPEVDPETIRLYSQLIFDGTELKKTYAEAVEKLSRPAELRDDSGPLNFLADAIEKTDPRAGHFIARKIIKKLPDATALTLCRMSLLLGDVSHGNKRENKRIVPALLSRLAQVSGEDALTIIGDVGWIANEDRRILPSVVDFFLQRLPQASGDELENLTHMLGVLARHAKQRPRIVQALLAGFLQGAEDRFHHFWKPLATAMVKDKKTSHEIVALLLKEVYPDSPPLRAMDIVNILSQLAKEDPSFVPVLVQARLDKEFPNNSLFGWLHGDLCRLVDNHPQARKILLQALDKHPGAFCGLDRHILIVDMPRTGLAAAKLLLGKLTPDSSLGTFESIISLLQSSYAAPLQLLRSAWNRFLFLLPDLSEEKSAVIRNFLDHTSHNFKDQARLQRIAAQIDEERRLRGAMKALETVAGISASSVSQATNTQKSNSFLKKLLGEKLVAYFNSNGPTSPLQHIPGSARQFQDGQQTLQRRMPTLWLALQNPDKMARLLFILSLLRMAYPYNLANASEKTPLQWAKENGIEFELNELHIAPVSESFRRHILYVKDTAGTFAVEIKMPGERDEKTMIYPEHFLIPQQLWEKYPNDPGVVQPLYYSQYQGEISLYGAKMQFTKLAPLGVMIFAYEDGKRLKNATPFLKNDSWKMIFIDPVVTAIRLHREGWRGTLPIDGILHTDMHHENVRVLPSGQGILVGDFGIFRKERLSMEERSRETLGLLSSAQTNMIGAEGVSVSPSMREAIYPEVVKRLAQGVTDPQQLKAIEEEVRQELGLKN